MTKDHFCTHDVANKTHHDENFSFSETTSLYYKLLHNYSQCLYALNCSIHLNTFLAAAGISLCPVKNCELSFGNVIDLP